MSKEKKTFPDTKAGQIARSIIESKPNCKNCNSRVATHTVDVDIQGDLEMFPCCDDCDAAMIALLKQQLGMVQYDNSATFSSNGWGRTVIDRGNFALGGI